MQPSAAEAAAPSLPKRDRLIVSAGLVGIAALAWIYLVIDAAHMQMMATDMRSAMAMHGKSAVDLVLLFLMWAVMMVAMMLPSAHPAVMTYAAIVRRFAPQQPARSSTAFFVLGYVLAWTLFSLVATGVQWGLERLALLSPMMMRASPVIGGLLLIGAGLYQWSPIKDLCLTHCRAPLPFLAQNWRAGPYGALSMGAHHGLYCIGCCWALMALLFVGGVMNLLWVAAISVFILLEKLAPLGGKFGRVATGLVAIAAGVVLIVLGW